MLTADMHLFMTALTLWREGRGSQDDMKAEGCVIRNRVNKNHSDYYTEVTKRWAFSSINAQTKEYADPQLSNWPSETSLTFASALLIAGSIINNSIVDMTGGATLYFDDSEKQAANFNKTTGLPKDWNPAKVKQTVRIGTLTFFKEL